MTDYAKMFRVFFFLSLAVNLFLLWPKSPSPIKTTDTGKLVKELTECQMKQWNAQNKKAREYMAASNKKRLPGETPSEYLERIRR